MRRGRPTERRIKIIEKQYMGDMFILRMVAERTGFLLWKPSAQRLYAFGDHQGAYMHVSEDDITFDILGDEARFYKCDILRGILILTSFIPTKEELKRSYDDLFSKGDEPLARFAIDDSNRGLIPDALNFMYEWRVGSGKLTYIKRTAVNFLMLNERKALIGRFEDGKLRSAIVLLKNSDRKPRNLKYVKNRIASRCEDAYKKLFGLS